LPHLNPKAFGIIIKKRKFCAITLLDAITGMGSFIGSSSFTYLGIKEARNIFLIN